MRNHDDASAPRVGDHADIAGLDAELHHWRAKAPAGRRGRPGQEGGLGNGGGAASGQDPARQALAEPALQQLHGRGHGDEQGETSMAGQRCSGERRDQAAGMTGL